MVVLEAIRRNQILAWHLEIFLIAVTKMESLEDFKICHLYKESNGEADQLSKWAANCLEVEKACFEWCSH